MDKMEICNLAKYCVFFAFLLTVCLLFSGCKNQKIKFPELIETREDQTVGVLCGNFTIKTRKYLNETSTVFFAIPFDFQTGRPRSSASNILFYAPFNGEAGTIRKGLPDWLREIAIREGCSIFTLTIEADTISVDDHRKYYIFKESGWHDIVFQIKDFMEERWGLEKRRLFLLGQSSGGSMIQQIATSFPERIDSAAWHGGSHYRPFCEGMEYPRMLASNTWGCYGNKPTEEMVKEGQKLGIDIEHVLVPPEWKGNFSQIDSHSAAPWVYEMQIDFLFKRDWKRRNDFKIEEALQGGAYIGPRSSEARGNIIFCTGYAFDEKEIDDYWRLLLWGTNKLNLNGAILQLTVGEKSENAANLRKLASQMATDPAHKVWVVYADEVYFDKEDMTDFCFVLKREAEWGIFAEEVAEVCN